MPRRKEEAREFPPPFARNPAATRPDPNPTGTANGTNGTQTDGSYNSYRQQSHRGVAGLFYFGAPAWAPAWAETAFDYDQE